VQTPYYEYGSENFWDPYGKSVYPNQHNPTASNNLDLEHVQNLFAELDTLKDEARRYKKAEAERLAELKQIVEDLRKEVHELEEQEAREEENALSQRTEPMVKPQTLPPVLVRLPFPQRAMLTSTTTDRSKIAEGRQREEVYVPFAETLEDDEFEESKMRRSLMLCASALSLVTNQ